MMEQLQSACALNDEISVAEAMPAAVSSAFKRHDGVEEISEILRQTCRDGHENSVRGILSCAHLLAQFLTSLKFLVDPAGAAGHVGVLRCFAEHSGALQLPKGTLLEAAARFAQHNFLLEVLNATVIMPAPGLASETKASEVHPLNVITHKQLGGAARAAAQRNSELTLQTLLNTGLVQASDHYECLRTAAFEGFLGVAQAVCTPHTQLDVTAAAVGGGVQGGDSIPSSIESGKQLDQMLSTACTQGRVQVLRYLLSLPPAQAPSATALGGARFSPFSYACGMGNIGIVQALLEYSSVHSTITDADCRQGFETAVEGGYRQLAELFLARSGQSGVCLSECAQLLSTCLERGHMDMVHLMVTAATSAGTPLPLRRIGQRAIPRMVRNHRKLHMFLYLLHSGVTAVDMGNKNVFSDWGERHCPELPKAGAPTPVWATDPDLAWLWQLQGQRLLEAAFAAQCRALHDSGCSGARLQGLLAIAVDRAARAGRTEMLQCIRRGGGLDFVPPPATQRRQSASPTDAQQAIAETFQGAVWCSTFSAEFVTEVMQHWGMPATVLANEWLPRFAGHGDVEQVQVILQGRAASRVGPDAFRCTLKTCLLEKAQSLQYQNAERQYARLDCACELLWGGWAMHDFTKREVPQAMGHTLECALDGLLSCADRDSDDSSEWGGEILVPIMGGLHLLLAAGGGHFDIAAEVGDRWPALRDAELPIPQSGAPDSPMCTAGHILGGVRWAGFLGCPRFPRRKMVLARRAKR